MSELPPLSEVNWDSHTCTCKVAVRRYVIEDGKCTLHFPDGRTEDIPIYPKDGTYVDGEGIYRHPGMQTRGHLSHRCRRHHNQTSTSLQSQLVYHDCGCVDRQITVGEFREDGVTHEQRVHICHAHKKKAIA